MFPPNSTWEQMEKFISIPLRVLSHSDDDVVGPLDDSSSWGKEHHNWQVKGLEQIWMELEHQADRLGPFTLAQKLSAGKQIPKRSFNTFQRHPKTLDYLEQLEVLRRAEPEFPKARPLIIMPVNKKDNHLPMILSVLCPGTDVRKELNTESLPSGTVDLMWANLYGAGAEEDSLEETQRFMSTVALAIRMLAKGGNLAHGSIDGLFACGLFALCRFFKEVVVMKPLVALDSEMKIHIVAKGFDWEKDVALLASFKHYSSHGPASPPLGMDDLPPNFLSRLTTTLGPFFIHVSECRKRNVTYANTPAAVSMEQVQRYQMKTATLWVRTLQLEEVYYAPRGKGPAVFHRNSDTLHHSRDFQRPTPRHSETFWRNNAGTLHTNEDVQVEVMQEINGCPRAVKGQSCGSLRDPDSEMLHQKSGKPHKWGYHCPHFKAPLASTFRTHENCGSLHHNEHYEPPEPVEERPSHRHPIVMSREQNLLEKKLDNYLRDKRVDKASRDRIIHQFIQEIEVLN